jgi:RRXRR protein
MFVPVVDCEGKPLMPTTPSRARRWIKLGEATPFFKKGIFCVRLNCGPARWKRQEIAVGIDPGSKKEGFTIKSEAHTYLNIQADAVQHVKDAVETRRNMRRNRRRRKTPCRPNRCNRARGCLPPSTKARWQWKLRIVKQLSKIFPITDLVVEDIKAKTTGGRRWNRSFSPLEVGKTWFYEKLAAFGEVHLKQGWETKEMRDAVGLKKTKSKLAEVFEAHCVDSWVLANWRAGGHSLPDNKQMLCVSPLRFHRRQLHVLQPTKGGARKAYGSTRSCGLKRGSLVKDPKWGLVYVGGTRADDISLHCVASGKRLTQHSDPTSVRFATYNTWRTRLLPVLKGGVSVPENR